MMGGIEVIVGILEGFPVFFLSGLIDKLMSDETI
jgi:hypothetical protein